VKSWIRIRIQVKIQKLLRLKIEQWGAVDAHNEAWRLTMEAWRLTMEAWRLTMEAWGITMEAWRLTVEAWRLKMKSFPSLLRGAGW
jgi:hypothetical protein